MDYLKIHELKTNTTLHPNHKWHSHNKRGEGHPIQTSPAPHPRITAASRHLRHQRNTCTPRPSTMQHDYNQTTIGACDRKTIPRQSSRPGRNHKPSTKKELQ